MYVILRWDDDGVWTTTTTTTTTTTDDDDECRYYPFHDDALFCAPGCEVTLLTNGHCDAACHTSECHYDYADCCEPAFFHSGSGSDSDSPNLHTRHNNVISFRVHE